MMTLYLISVLISALMVLHFGTEKAYIEFMQERDIFVEKQFFDNVIVFVVFIPFINLMLYFTLK